MNFPSLLFFLLEQEHGNGIIEWNSTFQAFRINDHAALERVVLPKYFKHANFTSVKRQLNLYGFKYMHRGDFKGCFYNPLFRRSDEATAKSIARQSKNKKRKEIQMNQKKLSVADSDCESDADNYKSSTFRNSCDIFAERNMLRATGMLPATSHQQSENLLQRPKFVRCPSETGYVDNAGSFHPSSAATLSQNMMPMVARPQPYMGSGVFRPSALTARIGFRSDMMQWSLSREDRDAAIAMENRMATVANPLVNDNDEVKENSMLEVEDTLLASLRRNSVSLENLQSFIGDAFDCSKDLDIYSGFNVW